MPAQVIDILTSAAMLCGSLAPGETLNASESQDFFYRLLDMQSAWSGERENLFVVGITELVATLAKGTYTLGPGAGDFSQARPILIQTASHVLNGITESLELVDSTNFASIQDRSATSKLILKLYCDYNSPVATLYVWPIPALPPTLELFTQTPLPVWVTIFDTVTLPDIYLKALKFNLAVNIAPDLGTPDNILQQIVPQAVEAKMAMREVNQMFLASQLGQNSTGAIPTVGVPHTTGNLLANPQPGGPVQMTPIGQ
jgi:hypothetical protein